MFSCQYLGTLRNSRWGPAHQPTAGVSSVPVVNTNLDAAYAQFMAEIGRPTAEIVNSSNNSISALLTLASLTDFVTAYKLAMK